MTNSSHDSISSLLICEMRPDATWKHWTAKHALLPSGLIGPVTLHCVRLVPVP